MRDEVRLELIEKIELILQKLNQIDNDLKTFFDQTSLKNYMGERND